jgi:hypothetical protein
MSIFFSSLFLYKRHHYVVETLGPETYRSQALKGRLATPSATDRKEYNYIRSASRSMPGTSLQANSNPPHTGPASTTLSSKTLPMSVLVILRLIQVESVLSVLPYLVINCITTASIKHRFIEYESREGLIRKDKNKIKIYKNMYSTVKFKMLKVINY